MNTVLSRESFLPCDDGYGRIVPYYYRHSPLHLPIFLDPSSSGHTEIPGLHLHHPDRLMDRKHKVWWTENTKSYFVLHTCNGTPWLHTDYPLTHNLWMSHFSLSSHTWTLKCVGFHSSSFLLHQRFSFFGFSVTSQRFESVQVCGVSVWSRRYRLTTNI
jgi:hypothetical protein